jgi:hypothetical protein
MSDDERSQGLKRSFSLGNLKDKFNEVSQHRANVQYIKEVKRLDDFKRMQAQKLSGAATEPPATGLRRRLSRVFSGSDRGAGNTSKDAADGGGDKASGAEGAVPAGAADGTPKPKSKLFGMFEKKNKDGADGGGDKASGAEGAVPAGAADGTPKPNSKLFGMFGKKNKDGGTLPEGGAAAEAAAKVPLSQKIKSGLKDKREKMKEDGKKFVKNSTEFLTKNLARLSVMAQASVFILIAVLIGAVFVVLFIKVLPKIVFTMSRWQLGNRGAVGEYGVRYYNNTHDALNQVWLGLMDLSVTTGDAIRGKLLKYDSVECAPYTVGNAVAGAMSVLEGPLIRYADMIGKVKKLVDIVIDNYDNQYFRAVVDHAIATGMTMKSVVLTDAKATYKLGDVTIRNNTIAGVPIARNIFNVVRTCMKLEAQRFVENSGFHNTGELREIVGKMLEKSNGNESQLEKESVKCMRKYIDVMGLGDDDTIGNAYRLHPTNTFWSESKFNTRVTPNAGPISKLLAAFYKAAPKKNAGNDDFDVMSVIPGVFFSSYGYARNTDFLKMGTCGDIIRSTRFKDDKLALVEFNTIEQFKQVWTADMSTALTRLVGNSVLSVSKDARKSDSYCAENSDNEIDRVACAIMSNGTDSWRQTLADNKIALNDEQEREFVSLMRARGIVAVRYKEVCETALFALVFKNATEDACFGAGVLGAFASIKVYEAVAKVLLSYTPPELIDIYAPKNLFMHWLHTLTVKYWWYGFCLPISAFWASISYTWGRMAEQALYTSVLMLRYYVDARNYLPKKNGGFGFMKMSFLDYKKGVGNKKTDVEDFAPTQPGDTVEHFKAIGKLMSLVRVFVRFVKRFWKVVENIWKVVKKTAIDAFNNPLRLIAFMLCMILWFAGTVWALYMFFTGLFYLVSFYWLIVWPFWFAVGITALSLPIFTISWAVAVALALVDVTLWATFGMQFSFSQLFRQVFLCKNIDDTWHDVPYSQLGNTVQPVKVGGLCFGCLRPCPRGYRPIVSNTGALKCLKREKDIDSITPGARIFHEVVEPRNMFLINAPSLPAPHNPLEHKYASAFRSICKYFDYVSDDRGAKKYVVKNCDNMFCGAEATETDCSCMKSGSLQLGKFASNLIPNIPLPVYGVSGLIMCLVGLVVAASVFMYVKRVRHRM